MPITPVVIALGLAAALSVPQRTDLEAVLSRAAAYADRYHDAFTTIVAEEHYVQRLEGTGAERRLRADFMLIRGVRGEVPWLSFRDIFEVDGGPVTGERGRLERWLAQSRDSFSARARALALEQARYNLGDVVRTINVPLLPLEFLLPSNQHRFRFRVLRTDSLGDTQVLRIIYEERRRPTIIRTPAGGNVEARGTFWIEPATGRVFRTELHTGKGKLETVIAVTYQSHERLGMLVPVLMEERYETPSAVILGRATYSNFRRFETSARIK